MSFYLEISNDRIKDDIESLTKVLEKGKFMYYFNEYLPKVLIILLIIGLLLGLITYIIRTINKNKSSKEKYDIVKARIEKEKEILKAEEENRKTNERKKKEENQKNNIFEPMCDNVNYMRCLSDMPNMHKFHCNNLKNSCDKKATKQCDLLNYNLCRSKVSDSLKKTLYCKGYIKDCL